MRDAVRLLSRIALAIALLAVASAVTSFGRSSASRLLAPLDVAARVRVDVERYASTLERAPRCVVEADGGETDLEDQDATSGGGDVALAPSDDAALVTRPLPVPRKPARARRSAARIATSRITVSTGIPRGPPA